MFGYISIHSGKTKTKKLLNWDINNILDLIACLQYSNFDYIITSNLMIYKLFKNLENNIPASIENISHFK